MKIFHTESETLGINASCTDYY